MNEWTTSKGLKPHQQTVIYQPGTVVKVIQQIPRRTDTCTTTVTGTVVRQERQETGSWFARNRNDRLWLDRLVLRKDDGETSILNLDEYSRVEVISGPGILQDGDAVAPLVVPAQDRSGSLT